MVELKIDKEFSEVLPTSEQRYKDLEAAVLKDGFFTDPFITWNGYIIDGHTRYRIMQNHPELDLKPYEKKMDGEFADRYAVIVWIATHQISRRNLDLNGFEWADVHKKAYDAEKKSVGAPVGNTNAEKQMVESEQLNSPRSHAGETATVLAKKFGMNSASQFKHSVRTANAMDEGEKIFPGFKEGLKKGTIKASKDSVENILSIKDEEEKTAYVKAIASGENQKPKRKKPVEKGLLARIHDLDSKMANAEETITFDDVLNDLNSIEDDFLSKVERAITNQRNMLAKDERWPDAIDGYFDSVIADIKNLKGRIIT